MAKAGARNKRVVESSAPAATAAQVVDWTSRWWFWPAIITLAVIVFYWIPLTSTAASIQWDAVDVHYSSQKYFADRLFHGLPFWTPYIFSGFPFLADPQVAAWYPPNWPFFLAGISAEAIQLELAVHALIALLGAYLLFRRMVSNRAAAVVGALFYAFSGFFAEHSSHVGMFTAASLLPWLLLGLELAIEVQVLRFTVLTGLVGGVLLLAGHFQTALYSFTAFGLFAVARVIERPKLAGRVAAIAGGTVLIAVLLSMIQTLPGLELTRESIRALADYSKNSERSLGFSGLLNLLFPNGTGVFNDSSGPATDAQYYLYSGFLLVPLAVAGWWKSRARITAGALIVLPLWYMLGPAGGFYRAVALLPGFGSVRSPIHFWFVPVLGLALLATAGSASIFERWNHAWVPALLLAVVFVDLYYWNSLTNPLAYGRSSFAELYANREQLAQEKIAAVQPPGTRFSMPDKLTVFGPLNHPLDLRLEATYGYNPLELAAYAQYRDAMRANPRLQNGLNVSRSLDVKSGTLGNNADVLPRAYFARSVAGVANGDESRRRLDTLDPATAAIVTGNVSSIEVDPQASAIVSADGEQGYRVHYRASRPGLVKVSVPYFQGWEASVDGQHREILRVDHALMGVVVPAGDKELVLRFHSTWFALGAWLSGFTLVCCAGLLAWPGLRRAGGE